MRRLPYFVSLCLLQCVFSRLTLRRDRDAKSRWANSVISDNWSVGFGGIGGTIISGLVKQGVGRVFR